MNHKVQDQEKTKRRYTKEDLIKARRLMLESLAATSGGMVLRGCCTQGCCVEVDLTPPNTVQESPIM